MGCIADQNGTNGNFSLDPLFCHPDTGNYHLDNLSPCLSHWPHYPPTCTGLIGALPEACSVYPDADGDGITDSQDNYVPPGGSVEVCVSDSLCLIFDSVSVPGFITIDSNSVGGGTTPDGYRLVPVSPPVYYHISTDAVFHGSVTICFTYDDSLVAGIEHHLRLWHWFEGDSNSTNINPTNITAPDSPDTVNNQICGIVPGSELRTQDMAVTSVSLSFIINLALTCCDMRVGDVNCSDSICYSGDATRDEPTIGDVSCLIDAVFITGNCEGIIDCLPEADINQSGGFYPKCDDITIGDISILIDYLFISPSGAVTLPDCL